MFFPYLSEEDASIVGGDRVLACKSLLAELCQARFTECRTDLYVVGKSHFGFVYFAFKQL